MYVVTYLQCTSHYTKSRCQHSYLSGLPTSSLSHENNTLVFLQHLHEPVIVLPHWQCLPLLQDLPEPLGEGSASVLVDLNPGNTREFILA